MRVRIVSKLGASLIAAAAAIALIATPASAGSTAIIYQHNSKGQEVGWVSFYGDLGPWCNADGEKEKVEVYDAPGGFGIEAQVYVRSPITGQVKWQRIATVRAWDDLVERCLDIDELKEVKVSMWQYHGSNKWNRKSLFAEA